MSAQRIKQYDYTTRYQQLASRVSYSNYISQVQRVQLGRGVFVPTAYPTRDASIVPSLKVGEILTTPEEQATYISRVNAHYGPSFYISSPPLNVNGTPGSGQVALTWDAPENNGGTPILYYTVISSPGSLTVTTSSLSATVMGLTNGLEYTFSVTATNLVGTSDATVSSPVTPIGSSLTTQSFTTVGDIAWLSPSIATVVEYLIVGGGGGGGNGYDTGGGGGGGAGVVLSGTTSVLADTNYTVTVGAGGVGGTATQSNIGGTNGSSSAFYTITALGGSGGYGSRTQTGGSGLGGEKATDVSGGGPGRGGGSAGTAVQGSGGGGGGAGSAGSNGVIGAGGAGGSGISSSLSGAPVTYGAGGAGARGNTIVTGATGTANRGNGGGGGGYISNGGGAGGNGGSGIVILRYYEP